MPQKHSRGVAPIQNDEQAREQQYFAAEPTSPDIRRELTVNLRGRQTTVQVSHGVFSGTRLDLGTSVLLRLAPQPPKDGTFLDIGCGWGPIALSLAEECPEANVWAVDVNERALSLTKANAESNGLRNIHTSLPAHVPEHLQFDLIWSNPPIRVGKLALHELLLTWLPRLSEQGVAYLVVQKNLGSDSLMAWLEETLGYNFSVSKFASSKGFRLIKVQRTA